MSGGLGSVIICALGIIAVLLAALTVATTQPPAQVIPDRTTYGSIWQAQHGAPDVEPTRGIVGGFVRLSYALSAPLARLGLRPDILTLWGLWLAATVPVVAGFGGRWPIPASFLVIISALTDGMDGCVAGLTGRSTRRGFVLDSVVDRASDMLFAAALVAAGGAAGAAVAAAGLLMMLEYTRARAGYAGMGEVGVVTVGERPARVIAAVIGLLAMGLSPGGAAAIGTGSLIVMAALSGIGCVQLGLHVARRLP